jgi:hypothetical protein
MMLMPWLVPRHVECYAALRTLIFFLQNGQVVSLTYVCNVWLSKTIG